MTHLIEPELPTSTCAVDPAQPGSGRTVLIGRREVTIHQVEPEHLDRLMEMMERHLAVVEATFMYGHHAARLLALASAAADAHHRLVFGEEAARARRMDEQVVEGTVNDLAPLEWEREYFNTFEHCPGQSPGIEEPALPANPWSRRHLRADDLASIRYLEGGPVMEGGVPPIAWCTPSRRWLTFDDGNQFTMHEASDLRRRMVEALAGLPGVDPPMVDPGDEG